MMAKIKDTIIKTVVKYLTISILALIGTVLAIIAKEIGALFLVKIWPEIPKKLLSELLLILLVICLLEFAYILFLKHKLKHDMIMRFGVLWTKAKYPYCPVCKQPLKYNPPTDETHPSLECPKCNEGYYLVGEKDQKYTIQEARNLL